MKMPCGCDFSPGRRIAYSDLRAHFDHAQTAIETAAQALFVMELIMAVNRDMDVNQPLIELRMKLFDAMFEYDEKVRPALDKKFPEDKLAEALGL